MEAKKILTVEDLTPPKRCSKRQKEGCGTAELGECNVKVPNLCLIYAEYLRRVMRGEK